MSFIAGSSIHRSLEARLAFLPLSALAAVLIYQGTNAAIYQLIGLGVYFWAYSEGEVSVSPTRDNTLCFFGGYVTNKANRSSAPSHGHCPTGEAEGPEFKKKHNIASSLVCLETHSSYRAPHRANFDQFLSIDSPEPGDDIPVHIIYFHRLDCY
jgi:hypothetical protein